MSRVAALALTLVAAVLIGCGTSKVANDATVTVSGTLLRPGGAPAAGITVGLVEEPDAISALVELTETVSTVGLVCLTQQVTICKGARKTTTDSSGHYSFTMTGSDSKNVLGNPGRFLVSAQLPSGAQVQTRFELTTATIAVPATTFWEPAQLSASSAADFVTYSFSQFPSAEYHVSLTRSSETIWSQAGSTSGKIDARALEDADAQFQAVATVRKSGVGVTFTTDYYSPSVPLHGKASAPLSRGANCAVAGPSEAVPVQPCPFTDGRFSGGFPSQSCPGASPTPTKRCVANSFVQLDLGLRRPLSAVFLHGLGLSAEATIETSDDGLKWTKVAHQKTLEFLEIALPAGTAARFVRLKSANEAQTIFALTEFSAY